MSSDSFSIRDQIRQDFGYDLLIAGGIGTRQDPLQIVASNAQEAFQTQILFLRAVNTTLRRFWRILSHETVPGPQGRILYQLRTETKEITRSEIVTQTNAHYFVFSLAGESSAPERTWFVYIDRSTNLKFPYEIGFVHFDKAIDNEKVQMGAGCTLQY